jgi:hypothetical protein
MNIPEDEWPGRYVASYSFGTDTLTLKADHTFSQLVTVGDEEKTIAGEWRKRESDGYLQLERWLMVPDGFGERNPDWMTPDRASLPVERIWGRLEINSGAPHPYRKR